MFTDRVKLKFCAGKGGDGIISWRREKFIPKGGPFGGNGGPGGSVVFQVDSQVMSLEFFRYRKLLKAENGASGGTSCQQGRQGKDLILKVPQGTLIKNEEGHIIKDLVQEGEKWTLCYGGKGGRGNASFASSKNRAPTHFTKGKEGESAAVELELKLIADVGLVGFPNAGKSTLISALTKARVPIAPYPFTTLKPNLGYIELEDYRRILIADIPGIIEGAHHNRGLGFEFLRHIERTHMLIFVLDGAGVDGRNPWNDYCVLKNELKAYSQEVFDKPFLIVMNKTDLEESQNFAEEFLERLHVEEKQAHVLQISAQEKMGLKSLLREIEKAFPPV